MIKVITGPMFAGKTKILIAEYNANKERRTMVCKPIKDNRFSNSKVVCRDGEWLYCNNISRISELISRIEEYKPEVVLLDELQFLPDGNNISRLVRLVNKNNIDLIISCLDLTSEMKPFELTAEMMAYADEVIKIKGTCECGEPSWISNCKVEKIDELLIGDEIYEPLCPKCYLEKNKGE